MQFRSENITKRFGAVTANDGVSLSFEEGKVYAILGENGAGKTTYLNILFGMYRPDSGHLYLDSEKVSFASPHHAIARSIYLVQQDFSLIQSLSVAENLALIEGSGFGPLNVKRVASKVKEMVERTGLYLDANALIEEMPMSFRQRAEILKGLYCDARIMLLDEPTSILGPSEVEELGRMLTTLAADNRIVIFTTHKLEQVIKFADYIIVLRNGRVVINLNKSEVKNVWELAHHMVGEDFSPRLPPKDIAAKQTAVVEVDGLKILKEKGRVVVDDLSFSINRQEILGLAGVAGNGQKELAEALVGLVRPHGGRILIGGTDVGSAGRASVRDKIGYIPEEGSLLGLVPDFSVADNLCLTTYHTDGKSMFLDRRGTKEKAETLVREFGINPPLIDLPARKLSGGNAHKVILAREISRPVDLLVAYNPTKGLDVKATALVHSKLFEKRNAGTGILLISEDLDEILQLSDRVAVMFGGRIVQTQNIKDVSVQQIGRVMAGQKA